MQDYLLKGLDFNTVSSFRQEALLFALAAPHITRAFPSTEFTSLSSSLLFYLDNILQTESFYAADLDLPLDLLHSAKFAADAIEVLLLQCDCPTVSHTQDFFKSLLALFNKLHSEITPVITSSVINEPRKIFNDIYDLLEKFCLVLAKQSYYEESASFERCVLRFKKSINEVLFKKKGHVKLQDALAKEHDFHYSEKFAAFRETLLQQPSTIPTDYLSVLNYYINPSKRAHSFANVKQVVLLLKCNPEKRTELYTNCVQTIEKASNDLESIEGGSIADFERLRAISEELQRVILYVDMISGQTDDVANDFKDAPKQFHDAAKKLNDRLDVFIEKCCEPIDQLPFIENTRILAAVVEKALASSKGSIELNPELARETMETDGFLEPIQQYFKDINGSPTIESILSKINSFKTSIAVVMDEHKKRFDQTNRDFYLRRLAKLVDPLCAAITEHCKSFEHKAREIDSVTGEIRAVAVDVSGVLEELERQTGSSNVSDICTELTDVVHTLSAIETGVVSQPPKEMIEAVERLQPDLSSAWETLKLVLPTRFFSSDVRHLLNAAWNIKHLSQFYEHDAKLNEILRGVDGEFQAAIEADEKEHFKAFFESKRQALEPIFDAVTHQATRNGREDTEWAKLFSDMIQEIIEEWKPPRSVPFQARFENSCKGLNAAIEELGQPAVRVPDFYDPLQNLPDLQNSYVRYLYAAGEKYGDKKYWAVVREVSSLQLQRDIEKIRASIQSMLAFINLQPENIEGPVKRQFAENVIAALAASKLQGYRKFEQFLDAAIQFLNETDIPKLQPLSLKLLKCCNKVLVNADPNEELRGTQLQQFLLQSYIDPTANPLGFAALRTAAYAKLIKGTEDKQIFSAIAEELVLCFIGQKDPKSINYEKATEHLRKQLPPELQLRKLSEEEEKNIVFNTHPYVVTDVENPFNVARESNPHLYIFNEWALDAAAPSNKKYDINIMPPLKMTVHKDMPYNELNLPDLDSKSSSNYISTSMVSRFIVHCAAFSKQPKLVFNKLGQVYESQHKHSVISGPSKAPKPEGYITFHLDEMLVEGKPIPELIAVFYLYDFQKDAVLTPPAVYQSDASGKMSLLNSSENVVFQVPQQTKGTILVCRLMHQAAADANAFNSFLFGIGKEPAPAYCPHNFAISYISLFDKNVKYNENVQFPDVFHLLSCSPDLENDVAVFRGLQVPPTQKLKIKMSLTHTYSRDVPQDLTYTWSTFKGKNLFVQAYAPMSTIPLITLRNLSFTFENAPKGKYVFFQAVLSDNDNDINKVAGMPCIVDYKTPVLVNQYRSTCIEPSTNCRFPDVVQFNVSTVLSTKAHIIISFFTLESAQGPKLYKISIIPLWDDEAKTWIGDISGEIPLFEQKKIDQKGYIPLKKLKPKSKTNVTLTMPSLYFPHANLSQIFDASFNDKTRTEKISTKDMSKSQKLSAIVPVTARLLKYVTPDNVEVMINFWATFDLPEILPLIRNWIYSSFDPLRLNQNFSAKIFDSFSVLIQANCSLLITYMTAEQIQMSINILKILPVMCELFTSSVCITAQENRELLQDAIARDKLKNLAKAVGYLVSRFYNLDVCEMANHSFLKFLFLIAPIWDSQKLLAILNEYLSFLDSSSFKAVDLSPITPQPQQSNTILSSIKPLKGSNNSTPPPQLPDINDTPIEIRSLEFKYQLYELFFHTNNLVAHIAFESPDRSAVMNALFDAIDRSFAANNAKLIRNYIQLLAQLCRDIEQYSSITQKCANIMFPYLTLASRLYTREELKNDYRLMQHFIIPVLFVLHEMDAGLLVSRYSALTQDRKNGVFVFFEYLVKAVLTPSTAKNTLGSLKKRTLSTEMKALQTMKTESSDINYALFTELSMRIIEFLDKLIRRKVDILGAIKPLSSLLLQLMNRHQTASTMKQVALIICHIIDFNQSVLFTNHNDFVETIMSSAMKLAMRNLRKARAASVTLIMHCFSIDYMCTKNVILSSQYFFDKFTQIVLDAPLHKLPIFGVILDKLKLFTESFVLKSFVELMQERISSGYIIYDALLAMRSNNRSPEFQTQQILTIADQFIKYPTLRLKWLKMSVDVNTKSELWSSVFVQQVRVASLCRAVVDRMKLERIPNLDLSFVPSSDEENRINLEHANEKQRHLLINSPDFSIDGIIAALEGAVVASKSNKLSRHLRFTLMQLVSLYEAKREFSILVGTVANLSEMYAHLAKDSAEPLFFYLLEKRSNGLVKSRHIFASPISKLDQFVDWLNDPAASRYEYGEQATAYSSIQDASKILANICVFPVHPRHSLLRSDTETSFYIDDPGKRYTFSTTVPLPSALSCETVSDCIASDLSDEAKLVSVLNARCETLSNTTDMVRLMLPTQELNNAKKPKLPFIIFTKHIEKASSQQLTDDVSKFIGNSEVQEASAKLSNVLQDSISVYKEAAKYENQEGNVQKLDQQVHTFMRTARQKNNNAISYIPRSDPLSYKKDYEDF